MFGKTDLNLVDFALMIPIIFFILLGISAFNFGDTGPALVFFGISGLVYYGRKWQTKKYWRKEAHSRETALDYSAAIDLWEKLGEIEEAGRVRKLQYDLNSPKMDQTIVQMDQTIVHGQTVIQGDQTVVQGDQITKTEIKDSVINKSSIGSDKD